MVPVTTTRTVTRDMGSYQTIQEEVPVSSGCGVSTGYSTSVSGGCGSTVSSGCGCAAPAPACGCAAPVAPACGCGSGAGSVVDSGSAYGGGVAPATRMVCKKVWVPNVVTEEVPVTTMQQQSSEETYTYNVTLYRDEAVAWL